MQNSQSLPLLLTFAPELIQLINDNLDIEDTKALRLTHRHLASTLSTSVLHTLTINIKTTSSSSNSNHHNSNKLSLAKLTLLASQSHSYRPAHRATRVLRILSLTSIPDSGLSEGGPEETRNVEDPEPFNANLVIDAISSLKGLHEVYWDLNQQEGDAQWPLLAVFSALAQIPHLQRIHIKTSQCNIIPLQDLHTLPSLRSLSFDASLSTCPDAGKAMFDNLARSIAILGPLGSLTSLSVSHNWRNGFRNQSFHTLFRYYPPDAPPMRLSHLRLNGCFVSLDNIVLPHLAYLTSLELTKIQCSYITREPPPTGAKYSRSDPEEIWREVQKAGIQLKEITIDFIPSSFLTYLSSYSGLRKLHVTPNGFNHVDSSDAISQRFFAYPLTRHAESLEDLEITARSEGLWCFGEHNVCVISKLTNLKNLRLGIISSRLWKKYDFKEGAAIRKPNADAVKLLLDTTTTSIPHLKTLRISPATPPNSRCGNASVSCYSPIGRQIAYNARKYAVPPSCFCLPSLSVCLNKSGYFKSVGGKLRVDSHSREGALGYDKMVITSEERRRYRI